MHKHSIALLLTLLVALAEALGQLTNIATNPIPLPLPFLYQGRLKVGTNPIPLPEPINGLYDFRFRLFTAPTAGEQVGLTYTNNAVSVINGLFSTLVGPVADLPMPMPNPALSLSNFPWLEISVRTNAGAAAWETLSPRQQLMPAPFASHALSANMLLGDALITGTPTFSAMSGPPFSVVSSMLVPNLNAQYLGGLSSGAFALSSHGHSALQITSGTLADARLSTNVALRSGGNTFTGNQVLSSGNLGVGTTDPQQRLHVVGLAQFDLPTGQISVSTPGGNPGLIALAPGGHRRDLVFDNYGMRLLVSGSASAASTGIDILENGDVGIGIDSPVRRLHVTDGVGANGSIQVGGLVANGDPKLIHFGDNQVSGLGYVYLGENGADDTLEFRAGRFYFNNGWVGIGTANPSYALHVNGSVAGVGAYNNLSDARYKKNIAPLTNALEKVLALRGVNFDWRQEENPDKHFEAGRQVGFLAQEVEEVLPEAVSRDGEGTRSMAYSKIIPVLVEAMKQQEAQVKQRDTQIEEVKVRLAHLEELLASKLNAMERKQP